MELKWVNNSQRQLGQKYQALELQDWKVRLDVERVQVPAKVLILGKLCGVLILSNFVAKTTRIVPAPLMKMVIWRRPIPRSR